MVDVITALKKNKVAVEEVANHVRVSRLIGQEISNMKRKKKTKDIQSIENE